MGQERVDQALGRIERALARIEAARSSPAADLEDGGELSRLREAHHTLRGTVKTAVAQIDRLLAGAERG